MRTVDRGDSGVWVSGIVEIERSETAYGVAACRLVDAIVEHRGS